MIKFSLCIAVVINDECEMLRIKSEGDMSRALQSNVRLGTKKAWEILTKDQKYVSPEDTLKVAVKMMENRQSQIFFLPVVKNIIRQGTNTNDFWKKICRH